MGAKTRLLDAIERSAAPLLAHAQGVPTLVDLFAGTGAVAARFARRARIVASDAQRYSATLCRALLVPAPDAVRGLAGVLDRARAIEGELLATFGEAAAAERRFLDDGSDLAAYRAFIAEDLALDPEETARAAQAAGLPVAVLSCYYRNVYFGVAQAVALDALRAALEGEPEPQRTLYLAALLFAASRATSGTAHFAQPRGLEKESELRAMIGRRRIDVRALFEARARFLAAEAARPFAGENEVWALAYEALFERLARSGRRVDLVYADPPYTRDQYSRFYHVLETLVEGGYPPLARDARGAPTAGRYPLLARRFQSRFANPLQVEDEFRRVTRLAAERGAALIWSYSRTNGVLFERWEGRLAPFLALLGEHYRHVRVEEHALHHSGAGDRNHAAIEVLAICEGPR